MRDTIKRILREQWFEELGKKAAKGAVSRAPIKSIKTKPSYIKGVDDNEIIAATIIGEAGGEGNDGMIAIKNVLDNRAKKKGTTAAGEALRPKQFSMWNKATSGVSTKDDFDSEKIQSVIDQYKGHSKWGMALRIARGNYDDLTKGANMYYAHKKIKPPYWTKDWEQTAVIGNHTFGKSG